MKIEITGASNFVSRMYQACGPYQWAREFLMNSLEAGASRVEFGIEWEAVKLGFHRRTITDNGKGMNARELVRFFSTLGEGAKQIGGVHDNFGVGAKIAGLPWNPSGMVVISYQEGKGSMIWIRATGGDYELAEFDTEEGPSVVIEPKPLIGEGLTLDWSKVVPEWARQHGTTVVLLGSPTHPNTVFGDPAARESDLKGLSVYLNSRFWELGDTQVTVAELRGQKLPRARNESAEDRRTNNRLIRGAKFYLTEVDAPKGQPGPSGTVELEGGRVKAHWFLWQGARPAIHSYAVKNGYVAAHYGREVFELSQAKPDFRAFGIVEAEVQERLTLVLEPQPLTTEAEPWGVHPDQSRARLLFTGNGQRGAKLPLYDWGTEFAANMPEPIINAIRAARADGSGVLQDEEYRKRLQDRFGSRWSTQRWVEAGEGKPARIKSPLDNPHIQREHGRKSDANGVAPRLVVKSRREAEPVKDGDRAANEQASPVDVPRYVFATRENFEKEWHLACWSPHDPEGPCVLINIDAPMLHDLVDYHRARFASVHEQDVGEIVMNTIGEIAVAKVAHCQKLTKLMPEELVDRDYRTESALTVGLMGFIAEEAVINRRLAEKLGRASGRGES